LALQVSLNLEFFFTFVFDAFLHTCVGVALVLTDLVVVGVVTVAVLANHLAVVLLLSQLGFGVSVDEQFHIHDILASSRAGVARIGGAKSKANKVLSVELTFLTATLAFASDLNKAAASQVPERVVGNERHVTFLFEVTSGLHNLGLAEQSLAQARVGSDFTRRGEVGRDSRGEQSNDSSTEHLDGWVYFGAQRKK
jgi:hypothetical protein